VGHGDGELLVAFEGHGAGEQLERHAGEAVFVGPAIDVLALDLLGRHVGGCAHERAHARQAGFGARLLGQPEVGQVGMLALSRLVDEHVAGLHVAVDEASCVGGVEGPGDLGQDDHGLVRIERPIGQAAGEVDPVDIPHREEGRAFDLARLVERDDVGMVDGRRESRLALEAGPEVGVLGQLVGQQLEGHLAPELALLGEVDDPHPTAA
jgi:hypothetical protein